MRTQAVTADRYCAVQRTTWDDFIRSSKNGFFLFERGYMDYHEDRFEDASLVFAQNGSVLALLPANLNDRTLYSHAGLTFGGVITDNRMRVELMLSIFDELRRAAARLGADRVVYKAIPHIYHRLPAEEDLYALAVGDARLVRRDVTSAIRLGAPRPVSQRRERGLRRAQQAGVEVHESTDFETFLGIQSALLAARYGVGPIHTPNELALLASRFPDHIRLFAAFLDGVMVGGIVVYSDTEVAHAQYIASSPEGRDSHALDAVTRHLTDDVYRSWRYFDFGISTEDEGRNLNASLIENKESYGARAIVHDWYAFDV